MIRLPPALAPLVLASALATGCNPVTGTGPGTPPAPGRFLHADPASRSAVVTLVAGYPATDYTFNYNGYSYGTLVITVPVGWAITLQCQNHATVPASCAVVDGPASTAPLRPAWSTSDPTRGVPPGGSESFTFTPDAPGRIRIASLVGGDEASGMWSTLVVTAQGEPAISAPGS